MFIVTFITTAKFSIFVRVFYTRTIYRSATDLGTLAELLIIT